MSANRARPFQLALVLGGGNALGSYQAGVYQALSERGYRPDWIVGTSAGAINGALIAGNAPERAVDTLKQFWQPGQILDSDWWPSSMETLRRSAAALMATGFGRPGAFGPIGPLGSWWDRDTQAAGPSLFDSRPLAATLERLIDFKLLNAGPVRYMAGAVDLESGEDVIFDTATHEITAQHVRASAALLPAFPPIEIAGRAYVDGGLSANLPLDPVLGGAGSGPMLCIAVDLLPISERRPRTLGEAAGRAQDLIFAAQSRRTVDRWKEVLERKSDDRRPGKTLVTIRYADQAAEVAGKGMDFSVRSVRQRWDTGYRDGSAVLERIAAGEIPVGQAGLAIFDG